jgi:hypothetical protein
MLPKSMCFVLAGLLVIPLWILMSYGITADGHWHELLLRGRRVLALRRPKGLAADPLSRHFQVRCAASINLLRARRER